MGKLEEILKQHLVDATAGVSLGNPVYALVETLALKMPRDTSWNGKLVGTSLAFIGFGTLFSRGRDLSKRIFKVTEESKWIYQKIHDSAYGVAYTIVVSPGVYWLSNRLAGHDDPILPAVATSAALSIPLGIAAGYAVDGFRNLTGVKPENKKKGEEAAASNSEQHTLQNSLLRFEKDIANSSSFARKCVAAGLATASAVATVAYYWM